MHTLQLPEPLRFPNAFLSVIFKNFFSWDLILFSSYKCTLSPWVSCVVWAALQWHLELIRSQNDFYFCLSIWESSSLRNNETHNLQVYKSLEILLESMISTLRLYLLWYNCLFFKCVYVCVRVNISGVYGYLRMSGWFQWRFLKRSKLLFETKPLPWTHLVALAGYTTNPRDLSVSLIL